MKTFRSGGVSIAYLDEGTGEPVLLIHGFASNTKTNWVSTGWISTLRNSGYRVIAFDNRGHGQSEKLYDVSAYGGPIMAEDARALLDYLEIDKAHVMGYSMGARISAFLTLNHHERICSVIFAGMGINLVRGAGAPGPIARALEAPSMDDVTHDTARSFRAFAEKTQSDLLALAACMRSAREKITPDVLATINVPVQVAVGTEDVIAGSGRELAELINGAQVLDIPGCDHMKAVGDRHYKEGVISFLAAHSIKC